SRRLKIRPKVPGIPVATTQSARLQSSLYKLHNNGFIVCFWRWSMSIRRGLPALFVIIAVLGVAYAEDRVQSELRFVGHNKAEKTAGVWVDGQYVGFVKELSGDKKIILLPGKHDVVVRQAWYNDFAQQVILEPGQVSVINVSLVRAAHPQAQA